MVGRYRIEKGSNSAHCCFAWSIVDAAKPQMIGDEQCGFETICECFEEADAIRIVNALNAFRWPGIEGEG